MAKSVFLGVVAILVLIGLSESLSVVNNVTVPSDILTTILFDEIKNNPNLTDIPVQSTGSYHTAKCVLALRKIVNDFPSLSVLPFIDSWGKFPSGLLYGHLKDLGNFDQCVRTSVKLNTVIGTVKGQYCFASVPLIQSQALQVPVQNTFDIPLDERALLDWIRISIAVCIPDICDPSLVQQIFERVTSSMLQGALSGIKINRCITGEKPQIDTVGYVGIVIFSIIGGLMVLSTAYDVYTDYFKKSTITLLLAFSVLTNGRKLFAISTTKSRNSIDCLTGIRVFSMVWVLLCHNYVFSLVVPLINYVDVLSWFNAAESMHILSATVSVDTFLFISGLLVAWIGFRELDKSKGKLNVPLMYFHRYIRLTPAVGAVILFYVSINHYIGSGPFRKNLITAVDNCRTTWWSTLLYVQNYVHPDNTCVAQTWYLAVDTQLYLLSPLILIPLWKWGRKCSPVLVLLSLLSIGCIIATFFAEGYVGLLSSGDNQNARTYMPTHTRYSVWLVGIGLGYFMHRNKDKSMRPSKLIILLGWIVCFVTILAILYAPYFTTTMGSFETVFEAAIYESLKRVAWAIALSWLVFACHFGFGGIVNSMLSHPWWQPLSRLTFSMYLVHLGVQCINFGISRTDSYFSNYQHALLFWSTFGTSVMAAIVLTLAFESPVLVIEKALLSGSKSQNSKTNGQVAIDVVEDKSVESTQKFA